MGITREILVLSHFSLKRAASILWKNRNELENTLKIACPSPSRRLISHWTRDYDWADNFELERNGKLAFPFAFIADYRI